MPQSNHEQWEKALRARQKLEEKYLFHPQVSLIDIGTDPQAGAADADRPVLRVHLRPPADKEVIDLPDQIDGIPVRLIFADYKLE